MFTFQAFWPETVIQQPAAADRLRHVGTHTARTRTLGAPAPLGELGDQWTGPELGHELEPSRSAVGRELGATSLFDRSRRCVCVKNVGGGGGGGFRLRPSV